MGVARVKWNCCRLGASSVYTIKPCTCLPCHFIRNHIRRMHVRLAVTCHLRFWQNDRDLLLATVVTYFGRTDTKIRVSTEIWPWVRTVFPCVCRDSNPRPFAHETGALPLNHSRFLPTRSFNTYLSKGESLSVCLSACTLETQPAGTKPRTSHHWSPGGERCGKRKS